MGPNKKLTKSQLTIMCKLGMGPNKEKLDSQFLQTMQVGWDDEINFAKISFLSHSHQKNDIEKNIKVWCHNFLSAQ
ncbi:hypothetical protein SA0759_02840 [Staphylococcus aureus]|nr:hypothetical protein SA0759_02840 [Staphylococcus aureus]